MYCENTMEKFACTIGSDMYGNLWGGKGFFIIEAESEIKAREQLYKDIGGYYSFIYPWDKFKGQIDKHELFQIPYRLVVILYAWAREMAPRFDGVSK